MNVRDIRIEDFNYPLPDERIALYPLRKRDDCKLLVGDVAGNVDHRHFSDLPRLLMPGTLVIVNETKVIRARLEFFKESGARIEIFLLEPSRPQDYVLSFAATGGCAWQCLVGNRKRWKEGSLSKRLEIPGVGKDVTLSVEIIGSPADKGVEVKFSWDNPEVTFASIIEAAGNIPIPPYLKRDSEVSDNEDYQTVYSRVEGSVAAPTAGLHFTPELIDRLKKEGCEFEKVTLHVGAGTFQPVKSDSISGHDMHTEHISVPSRTIKAILRAFREGRDILAVGTTTVRTLESLPYIDVRSGSDFNVGQWMPYEAENEKIDVVHSLNAILEYLAEKGEDDLQADTSIMIAPSFRWRIVNRLITNFHQPKSTLLLLVSSFLGDGAGRDDTWLKIYGEALAGGYRFLSYGDACLFTGGVGGVSLPYAKSMFIRKATMSALGKAKSSLDSLAPYADCRDSREYLGALRAALLSVATGQRVSVCVYEGAAPLRFLVAVAASLPGCRIDIEVGENLGKRPILPLIDCLRLHGADIRMVREGESLSISIDGKKLAGGAVDIPTNFTGQYLSALMMASLLWEEKAEFDFDAEETVSRPYIEMTRKFIDAPDTPIERDWSAAAFFYEYKFIRPEVPVRFARLGSPSASLQGDSRVEVIFRSLGVSTCFRADGSAVLSVSGNTKPGLVVLNLKDTPDLVPPLAVALMHSLIPFKFTGVGHLRFKECDRLAVLREESAKLGYDLTVSEESLSFDGRRMYLPESLPEIDPHGDHRIAMSFYPLELLGEVRVTHREVVEKSFPDFFKRMSI